MLQNKVLTIDSFDGAISTEAQQVLVVAFAVVLFILVCSEIISQIFRLLGTLLAAVFAVL